MWALYLTNASYFTFKIGRAVCGMLLCGSECEVWMESRCKCPCALAAWRLQSLVVLGLRWPITLFVVGDSHWLLAFLHVCEEIRTKADLEMLFNFTAKGHSHNDVVVLCVCECFKDQSKHTLYATTKLQRYCKRTADQTAKTHLLDDDNLNCFNSYWLERVLRFASASSIITE